MLTDLATVTAKSAEHRVMPAPAMTLRPVDHLRPHGVEVKVPDRLAETPFILHQLHLKATLIQVSGSPCAVD